jgi:signal transduction histidine kinase
MIEAISCSEEIEGGAPGRLDGESDPLAETREALAQARAAVARRDEMIAVAAHDLRTPIHALLMQLERMKKVMKHDSAENTMIDECRHRLAAMAELGERLARMVNDLFDQARLKAEERPLRPQICDLSALVRDSIALLEGEIARSGSVVTTVLAPRANGWWDPLHIRRVIVNLVSNALKYGQRSPIEIAVEADEAKTSLLVRDAGPGIAESDQERIFRRYVRADHRDDMKGMGLGLHIAREIVELHGGFLRVRSLSGKGSTFEVCLPRGQVENARSTSMIVEEERPDPYRPSTGVSGGVETPREESAS